jgi:hypothetical protein
MAPVDYSVIWADDPLLREGDMPLTSTRPGDPPITGAWLHAEAQEHPAPRLPHWWSYITMQCRLALFDRMELERRAGNTVLMSNFDSLLLEQRSAGPTSRKDAPGVWRQRKLHKVTILGARSFTSKEKTRTPGVKRDIIQPDAVEDAVEGEEE